MSLIRFLSPFEAVANENAPTADYVAVRRTFGHAVFGGER